MHVHFVVHESFEAPGAFETWVRDRAHSATYSRVYAHEPLPQSADGIDLLVVMGGPQNPGTTREECPHFDAAAEIALITQCIEAQKAVFGACLGAQLIGEALGAKFERSPEKEMGKYAITLTREGLSHDKLAHFGNSCEVGHWHNDMPGLTRDAKVLAYSAGCPRQIVEYSKLVYGFQCHMELNREVIELLIAHCEDELARLASHRYVQQPAELRNNHFDAMNAKLFVFLDKLLQEYHSVHART
jgi:GMP synthase (glutamine-hydrolysing)